MKRRLQIIRVLSIVALAVSIYLTWGSFSENAMAGCDQEGAGCDEVLKTRWSLWFGMPITIFGTLLYAATTALSFLLTENSNGTRWRQFAVLATIAGAGGLWFSALQLLIIKSICYYCMTVHLCGVFIAALTLTARPAETVLVGKKGKKQEIRPIKFLKPTLLGLLAAGILAIGQLLPEKSEVPESSVIPSQSVPSLPAPPEVPLAREGEVSLVNGKVILTKTEFPLLGPADSSKTVALLYDYTCPACRRVHPQVMHERKKYASAASVIMIPMPLDAVCNPSVHETSYQHKDACQFAKIGLIIWKNRQEAFRKYDEFMFASEFPPSLDRVLDFAGELIGPDLLKKEMANPEFDQRLARGIQLFNSPFNQRKVLPTIFTPGEVIQGMPMPIQLSHLFR